MEPIRPTDLRPEEALALAHVRKVKGFYVHLIQYVLVIGPLAVVNFVWSPNYWWFLWAAFGWGIGLAAHAFSTFQIVPFFDGAWEKRQVEKRLGRQL